MTNTPNYHFAISRGEENKVAAITMPLDFWLAFIESLAEDNKLNSGEVITLIEELL